MESEKMTTKENKIKWSNRIPKTQAEIRERHTDLHPTDLGVRRKSMDKVGIVWRKWGTKKDLHLEECENREEE